MNMIISSCVIYTQIMAWLVSYSAGQSCLAQVSRSINDNQLWQGFRVPALIRFVNEESAYLSLTSGGPRMYINMEDYVSRQTGSENIPFLVRSITSVTSCSPSWLIAWIVAIGFDDIVCHRRYHVPCLIAYVFLPCSLNLDRSNDTEKYVTTWCFSKVCINLTDHLFKCGFTFCCVRRVCSKWLGCSRASVMRGSIGARRAGRAPPLPSGPVSTAPPFMEKTGATLAVLYRCVQSKCMAHAGMHMRMNSVYIALCANNSRMITACPLKHAHTHTHSHTRVQAWKESIWRIARTFL